MNLEATKPIARSLLVASLVLVATAYGQDSEPRVKMKDLPAAVRKTVEDQSKGSALRGLSIEVEKGQTFYEAELKVNGHNNDLLIDSTGSIVEIEEVVALNSLPVEVKATILKGAAKVNHHRRIYYKEQHPRGLRGSRYQGGEKDPDKSNR